MNLRGLRKSFFKKSLVSIMGLSIAGFSLKNLSGCGAEIPLQVYDDIEYLMNLPEDADINTLNRMAWNYGIPTMYYFELNQAPNIEGTYSFSGTEYNKNSNGSVSGPYQFTGTWKFFNQDSDGNIAFEYSTPWKTGASSSCAIVKGEGTGFTIYSNLIAQGNGNKSRCYVVFEGTKKRDKVDMHFIGTEKQILNGSGLGDSFGNLNLQKK